ncbi:hypothetical protein N7457_003718 [Penicillium paradoxum]|uniref:uncharacterized protein n=1 Tax=Penicillium paradoxum TaxID=176176 RepID=UPI0025479427|nr:uncharacterized protein N7457_003718 [Penicillium paradoxum]KAJ5788728.1 hypothetical protein N7457_003718 [Penicillium paradoxum]
MELGNQLSAVLQNQLTPDQESAFETHILNCLAGMVYGSNMIERAGNGSKITLNLCMAIFRGEECNLPPVNSGSELFSFILIIANYQK